MSEKRCARCGDTKPLTEFGNLRASKDGKSVYCRACINADAAARRVRTFDPSQPRACRHCANPFQPHHYNVHFCSDACRRTYQDAAKAETSRRHYQANWAHRRALAKLWRNNNREVARKHRRDGYYRDPAKNMQQHRDWVERNREYVAAYNRDLRRQKAAIAAGKERGQEFTLVRYTYKGETDYRAGRRDRPLTPNEQIVAIYEHHEGRWVVYTPPLANTRQAAGAQKLARREFATYRRTRHYTEAAQ